MKTNKALLLVLGLTSFTFLSGLALSSSFVSADDDSVVDEINITVPSSCNLTGIGNTSHTATINNGTYVSDIGTTTIKAFCNDQEGFAIYAIGYTDDTDGKNVLTSSVLGSTHDIVTGTGTSGNSQWAMKLSTQTSPEPDYPITIENNYNNYHTVPDDYELVAKRTASTDVGTNAIGSTLTSTYQVYISQTQSAGTYVGQVKYVLVHPNYVDSDALKDAVTVVFNGNDLTFPNGQTTNTVKYANVCKPGGYGYVANTPYTTVGTSNLNSDGTQKQESPSYTDSESILQTITVPNADKVKVVVDYGITEGVIVAIKGAWDGNSEPDEYKIIVSDYEKVGTGTAVLDGNEVTLLMDGNGVAPESGYDYGAYFKIYAVYDTEQPGTTGEELPSDDCSIVTIFGTYTETSIWNGKWTAEIPYERESCYWDDELGEEVCETITGTDTEEFKDTEAGCSQWGGCWDEESAEQKFFNYIKNNFNGLKGTTLTLTAYDPVTFDEVYIAANKTKLNNYYKIQDLDASMCSEVSSDETTTVIDSRDNNIYNIVKLSDGNCWLRDNLRLNPLDTTTATNMSSSNTNAPDDAIFNYLHGGNSGNVIGWTATAVSGPSDWPISDLVDPFIYNSSNPSYGIYYNYCAATVGTYCYTSQSSSYADALYDVCPVHWQLPSRNQLVDVDPQDITVVFAGEYDSGSTLNPIDTISGEGSRGSYWTLTYANSFMQKNAWCTNGNCYDPYESSSSNGTPRYRGLSIRCIVNASN